MAGSLKRWVLIFCLGFAKLASAEVFVPAEVPTRLYSSDISLFSPHLNLAGEASAFSQNETKTLNYRTQSIAISGAFPILGYLERGADSEIFQVFGFTKFSAFKPDTEGFLSSKTFFKPNLGLLALSGKTEGRFYLLTGGVCAAEDEKTFSSLVPLYYGLGMFSVPWTQDTNGILGGGYLYLFGKGLLFPIIGVLHRFNPQLSLFAILPLNAKLKYQLDRKTYLAATIKIFGGQYRFANNGEFSGSSEKLFYRTSEVRMSVEATYYFTKLWSAKGELGFTGKRNVRVVDENEDVKSDIYGPSGYGLLTVSYALSESLIDLGI